MRAYVTLAVWRCEGKMVNVSYQAQEQVKRLSAQERAELTHILGGDGHDRRTKVLDTSGLLVSRFGRDLRVLWRKADSGDVVVLSVVSKQSPS